MIYTYENEIFYSDNHDITHKQRMASEQLTQWQAKQRNKYWNKELMENVKRKIEIYTEELVRLKQQEVYQWLTAT
jgi:DNA-binding protein Fis